MQPDLHRTLPTDLKSIERAFLQTMSREKFELQRNLAFAGAALSAAILVALTQVGARELSLKVTTLCAAFALPFWIAMGFMFEMYLHLGPESYPHSATRFPILIGKVLSWIAALGLFAAMAGVVWFLMPWAVALLVIGTVSAILLFGLFIYEFASWWDHRPHRSFDK